MFIRWNDEAEADLDEIFDYILDDNPMAAKRMRDAIFHAVGLLADQPSLGRVGRWPGTRELVVPQTPYIIGYTVEPGLNAVVVLRIVHGARRWPDRR